MTSGQAPRKRGIRKRASINPVRPLGSRSSARQTGDTTNPASPPSAAAEQLRPRQLEKLLFHGRYFIGPRFPAFYIASSFDARE
jgi:hypothetical protein